MSSSQADLRRAVAAGTPLHEALAEALRLASVEVAYWLEGVQYWADYEGRRLPPPDANEHGVALVQGDAGPLAALLHDPAHSPDEDRLEAVMEAARANLESERLRVAALAEMRLLGTLADTAPSLLSNVDTEGRILKLNPTALAASGFEHEDEIRGMPFWDVFIDPDERGAVIERFAAESPDFPPSEHVNVFTNARGERLVIAWYSAPVKDAEGRVVSIVAAGVDLTERRRREEEARAGAERLHAVIESAPVAIVELGLDDRVIHWNPAAERMFGWTAEEILGKQLPLVPPDRKEESRGLNESSAQRPLTGFETVRQRRDGSLVDVEISIAPIRDAAGELVGHMAVYSDITERRMREQAVERQRRFLNAITEAVPSFIVAVDPEGCVVEHNNNRAFLDAFGWNADEIVGESFLGLIAREDDHDARMAIANAANGVPQPEQESRWFDRFGRELIVAWTARPVLDPEDRKLVLVSGSDVTVRKRQEEELRASRARIVKAEDDARRALERNLHDGAQQRLVALSVQLHMVDSKLRADPEAAAATLANARSELTRALDELRELARGIHPAILTDRGLAPALEAVAGRTPFPVELSVPTERLPAELEAAAYYVVAESLTNAAKYADPRSATVTVTASDGKVEITVADDGSGGADPTAGSGLRGLADRVEALDGRLLVVSPPGAGTRITAEIPLQAEGQR